MESILKSTKLFIGYDADDDSGFDTQIIECINTDIMTLTQLGVGPPEGFEIEDETSTWQDFLGDNVKKFSAAKSYIHKKCKLAFDSSTMSSGLIAAYERQCAEHEWRLREAAESK